MIVTDASFWVSALLARDVHHGEANVLLRRMVAEEIPAFAPAFAIVEVAGALVRRTRDPVAAEKTVRHIQKQPWLTLVPMTVAFAEIAARMAINCALRGADAIYVALAHQEGLPLITRDNEILQRGPAAALVMTPADWLRQNPMAKE